MHNHLYSISENTLVLIVLADHIDSVISVVIMCTHKITVYIQMFITGSSQAINILNISVKKT